MIISTLGCPFSGPNFVFTQIFLTQYIFIKKFWSKICNHNPNENTAQPQHNLNSTLVGLEMKITLHTTPPQKLNESVQEPQINIYTTIK